MDKVWLVTGSASGLGRNIAEAVLESGDKLVATARDPRRLDDLVAAASTQAAMAEYAQQAHSLGCVDVAYGPVYHGRRALVGWRFQLRKPP